MAYTAGDGVKIEGNVISAKISEEADNATGILNGAIYTPATTPTDLKPLVSITVNPVVADLTVTATKGETVLSGTTDANGMVEFDVPSFGVWTISAEYNSETWTKDVVVGAVQEYVAILWMSGIYGVSWDGSSSPVLTRTDSSESFPDPVAAIGTGEGSSPFDNIYPWSAMEEYNVIDGAIAYKRGEDGFSRADYDTVVYIPEFYYQAIKDSDGTKHWRISPYASEGFKKHPGSGKYVAKYLSGSGYVSKTGLAPLGNISFATARTSSTAKGSGWYQYDYMTHCAILLLYLVEYANWNADKTLGDGKIDSNTKVVTKNGTTDSMVYHTGQFEDSTGYIRTQYRNIENVAGNSLVFVEGILHSSTSISVNTDPNKYSNAPADGTTLTITIPAGNSTSSSAFIDYITDVDFTDEFPWVFIPVAASGGSEDTYIADQYAYYSGVSPTLCSGLGLFYFNVANGNFNTVAAHMSSRLIFDPNLAT